MDLSRLAGLAGKLQHSTLSLLIWDEAVDVVMLERSILGPSICVMERFPNIGNVFDDIAARILETGKTPSRVTVCLPRAGTVMRTLRYPSMVQNDLEQMVQFEATRHLPFPEAERCLGYAFALAEDESSLDVHLLAARSSDVSRLVDSVQAAGLPVDVVLGFSSLAAGEFGDIPSLLVVSDATHIEVSLVCRGLVCDSMCMPRVNESQLNGTVQRMIASNHERIGPGGVARLVFAGPTPLAEGRQEELSVTLGIDSENLRVPETLTVALDEFGGEILEEGLLAVSSIPPPSLNLTAFSGRRVPLNRRTKWILGLAVLLLLEVVAGWILWTHAPARALKGIESELSALRHRAAPAQKLKDQNRVMRNELMQLHDLVNNRESVMEMLKILSDKIPEDTYLTEIDYERGGRMRIKGRSKEPDVLPALLLLDVPFVSTIEASDIDEKRGEYHSFSFTFSLKGAGDE